ncbi:histidine phosphatase family protein, partial [Micrococcus luteus]|nr:histidine phosphatase family protein [Micrococcus luteus]
ALRALRGHVPPHWGDTPRDGGAQTLLAVAHGALIRAATGLLLRHEGEAFAAMERIGNARAAVLQGAFAPDAGAEGWGDWTLEGYGI